MDLARLVLPLEPSTDEVSEYATAIRTARADKPDAETARAMEAAAREGDPRAWYALATWHLHGSYGYGEAPHLAIPLLRRAAQGGVREAMYDLAVCFDLGKGTEENAAEAYRWYLRAALRGDLESIGLIANYTAAGHGVPPDSQLAVVWYELVEKLGIDVEDAASFRRWLEEQEE